MLSKYFEMKVATKKFDDDLKWTLGEIKDKKVIIYGAGEGFSWLLEKYPLRELNVVAIADKKFEKEDKYSGFKAIPPEQIEKEDYDVILITNENIKCILNYLEYDLGIVDKEIKTVFQEEIADERANFNYLEEFNFAKHLKKLEKKLKDKKIVIYGAGAFLEAVVKFYDLSKLNIIGVADRRFEDEDNKEKKFLGYKTMAPSAIENLKPDYVLVATKFFINIIEDLDENVLHGSKIKIKPLQKKPFLVLWKEIWG